ncbi:MAG: hypothetical protein ACUZ8E_14240 [Candidatus Anammoxibacter sp.]
MTPLETKIVALLVDCERIMEPYIMTAEKWERISKTQSQTKTVIDKNASLLISYGKSSEKIKKLKSYMAANEAFGRDKIFSGARKVAGMTGTLDGVLHYLLKGTCKITEKSILFNHVDAVSKLRQLSDILTRAIALKC